jgi:hypothetical protein
MVGRELPKLETWVRFPSPVPLLYRKQLFLNACGFSLHFKKTSIPEAFAFRKINFPHSRFPGIPGEFPDKKMPLPLPLRRKQPPPAQP